MVKEHRLGSIHVHGPLIVSQEPEPSNMFTSVYERLQTLCIG